MLKIAIETLPAVAPGIWPTYHSTPTIIKVSTPNARKVPNISPVTRRGLDRVTPIYRTYYDLRIPFAQVNIGLTHITQD